MKNLSWWFAHFPIEDAECVVCEMVSYRLSLSDGVIPWCHGAWFRWISFWNWHDLGVFSLK